MVVLNRSDVNFQNAIPVISSTQKFVIPVPALKNNEGNVNLSSRSKKFIQPIFDSRNNSINTKGIVFMNEKNKNWQMVSGDGTGCIVINEVSQTQARILLKKVMQLTNDNPEKLNADNLKVLLKFAHTLGLKDVSATDKTTLKKEMTVIPLADSGYEYLGLHKQTDKKNLLAVRYTGAIQLENSKQLHETGCVVMLDDAEENIKGVKTNVFLKNYTKVDGSPLTLFDVPIRLTPVQSKFLKKDENSL